MPVSWSFYVKRDYRNDFTDIHAMSAQYWGHIFDISKYLNACSCKLNACGKWINQWPIEQLYHKLYHVWCWPLMAHWHFYFDNVYLTFDSVYSKMYQWFLKNELLCFCVCVQEDECPAYTHTHTHIIHVFRSFYVLMSPSTH